MSKRSDEVGYNLRVRYEHACKKVREAKKSYEKFFEWATDIFYINIYQFNCTPRTIFSLNDLLSVDFKSRVRLINASKNALKIFANMNKFFICLKKEMRQCVIYQKKYYKYCGRENYSRGLFEPSSGESIIINNLKMLTKNYNLLYFYKYRWPFCKDKATLEYDFYCILLYDNHIYQFVIEFDGGFHFESTSTFFDFEIYHKHDILKQYYLFHRSIHLLRLNEKNNNIRQIILFINTLISSDEYIIVNRIDPIKNFFQDKSPHYGLKIFYDYCLLKYNNLQEQIEFYDLMQ